MVCINNKDLENELSIGKKYSIIGGTYLGLIFIKNDKGNYKNYSLARFATNEQIRDKKLNQILNNK